MLGHSRPSRIPLLAGALLVLGSPTVQALELEPGFYRSAPVGLNALSVGYSYSGGNVLIDDSAIEIENAKAHLHVAAMSYAHYFGIFGRVARADALVPVAWGHYEGRLDGQLLTRDPH